MTVLCGGAETIIVLPRVSHEEMEAQGSRGPAGSRSWKAGAVLSPQETTVCRWLVLACASIDFLLSSAAAGDPFRSARAVCAAVPPASSRLCVVQQGPQAPAVFVPSVLHVPRGGPALRSADSAPRAPPRPRPWSSQGPSIRLQPFRSSCLFVVCVVATFLKESYLVPWSLQPAACLRHRFLCLSASTPHVPGVWL